MWRSLFPREEEMNKKYEGYEVKVNFLNVGFVLLFVIAFKVFVSNLEVLMTITWAYLAITLIFVFPLAIRVMKVSE